MKILYFKGKTPNFGDELNWYIFHSLFEKFSFENQMKNSFLLGVGSILHKSYFEKINENSTKIQNTGIVFGAGVREEHLSIPNKELKIYFVRGPISARITKAKYISDAAYLLKFINDIPCQKKFKKKHRITIIPYYRHINSINWNRIKSETAVNIVMPNESPDYVISEIKKSSIVIGGAMHGCIVADIFRVPWIRMRFKIHEQNNHVQTIKWNDWSSSVNINSYSTVQMSQINSNFINENTNLENEIINKINKINTDQSCCLSNENTYKRILDRLHTEILKFSTENNILINTKRTIF